MFIVRYGEIALKRGNRRKFEERLANNIVRMLRRHGFKATVKLTRGRFLVYASDSSLPVFSKIPGIVSFSPAKEMRYDEIESHLAHELKRFSPRTFKIETHRVDKSFPKTSVEINQELGDFVVKKFGWKVNLDNPELRIGVEIINSHAYVFFETYRGIGGLPVGSAGKLIALISAGIDSPVAAFMMMRRGAKIIALHFSINPDDAEKVRKYVSILNQYSPEDIELIVEEYASQLKKYSEALKEMKREEWICVLCKYTMLKRAGEIAEKKGALGIVTGDSLGQVATQTLQNMRIISSATSLPVYRPLIGMDKSEIEKIARKIGTYDVFISSKEKKCPFKPRHVITRGDYDKFREILQKIQIQVS